MRECVCERERERERERESTRCNSLSVALDEFSSSISVEDVEF